ncbi:MAG: DUF432 domain-containing protein [Candidatus Altiarchaeota archaeon]|nr:DUF432 domain-containing protein [Candidatus Altiarchaeota archaeon]
MFGTIEIGKSHKTADFTVTKKNGFYVYKRDKKTVELVAKKLELEIRPMMPTGLPEELTTLFLVKYNELVLGASEKTIIFLKIPIEVGVFFKGELIDRFGFVREDFELYGPVDGGRVVRAVNSNILENPDAHKDQKSAIIPLRIKNFSRKNMKSSQVLIDSNFLEIYYDKKRVATEMVKLDIRDAVSKVRYLNKAHFKGMTKITASKQTLKREEITDMRWDK